MNYYYDVAKRYFLQVEGRHLYPSHKDMLFWAWIVASAGWLLGLVWFMFSNLRTSFVPWAYVLVPEVAWFYITAKISSRKDAEFVRSTNDRHGANLKSAGDCRSLVLRALLGKESEEFLTAAKEIDDLRSLKKNFRRRSDVTLAELVNSLYSGSSKDRLVNFFAILVAVGLAVKVETTFDDFVQVVTNKDYLAAVAMGAFFVAFAFTALQGLRVLASTLLEVLEWWSARLSDGALGGDWFLAYLGRDLVTYHRGSTDVVALSERRRCNRSCQDGLCRALVSSSLRRSLCKRLLRLPDRSAR